MNLQLPDRENLSHSRDNNPPWKTHPKQRITCPRPQQLLFPGFQPIGPYRRICSVIFLPRARCTFSSGPFSQSLPPHRRRTYCGYERSPSSHPYLSLPSAEFPRLGNRSIKFSAFIHQSEAATARSSSSHNNPPAETCPNAERDIFKAATVETRVPLISPRRTTSQRSAQSAAHLTYATLTRCCRACKVQFSFPGPLHRTCASQSPNPHLPSSLLHPPCMHEPFPRCTPPSGSASTLSSSAPHPPEGPNDCRIENPRSRTVPAIQRWGEEEVGT